MVSGINLGGRKLKSGETRISRAGDPESKIIRTDSGKVVSRTIARKEGGTIRVEESGETFFKEPGKKSGQLQDSLSKPQASQFLQQGIDTQTGIPSSVTPRGASPATLAVRQEQEAEQRKPSGLTPLQEKRVDLFSQIRFKQELNPEIERQRKIQERFVKRGQEKVAAGEITAEEANKEIARLSGAQNLFLRKRGKQEATKIGGELTKIFQEERFEGLGVEGRLREVAKDIKLVEPTARERAESKKGLTFKATEFVAEKTGLKRNKELDTFLGETVETLETKRKESGKKTFTEAIGLEKILPQSFKDFRSKGEKTALDVEQFAIGKPVLAGVSAAVGSRLIANVGFLKVGAGLGGVAAIAKTPTEVQKLLTPTKSQLIKEGREKKDISREFLESEEFKKIKLARESAGDVGALKLFGKTVPLSQSPIVTGTIETFTGLKPQSQASIERASSKLFGRAGLDELGFRKAEQAFITEREFGATGEATAILAASVGSELIGRRLLGKQFYKGYTIKTGFVPTFKAVAPAIGVAGSFEGASISLTSAIRSKREILPSNLLKGATAGAITAGTLGGVIAASAISPSKRVRAFGKQVFGGAVLGDPLEIVGDIGADIFEKGAKRFGVPVLTSSVLTDSPGKGLSTFVVFDDIKRKPTKVKESLFKRSKVKSKVDDFKTGFDKVKTGLVAKTKVPSIITALTESKVAVPTTTTSTQNTLTRVSSAISTTTSTTTPVLTPTSVATTTNVPVSTTITVPSTITTPTTTTTTTITPTTTINVPVTVPTGFIPKLPLPSGGGFAGFDRRRKGRGRGFRFTPSLAAPVLGVFGKAPKTVTSLQIRPIPLKLRNKRLKGLLNI